MRRLFAPVLMLLALSCGGYAQTGVSPAEGGKFIVLDHVVAVINGDVLLESDVDEEMHFAALEPFQLNAGKDTRQDAMLRLINQSLIVQQMKEQQQFDINISDAEVEKSLNELRSHLPQCVKYDCKTAAGWKAFLAANDLTSDEVNAYWKQRLAILRFIDLRFRAGIRIPHESVAEYYAKSVVPAFERQHETAPPLDDVASRIQQVLLQQQVNGLLQDWLKSMRGEGSVRILDPAYAPAAASSGAGEDD
jgi:peptidyl-prolyl cis-trans isomerase SurA